MSKLKRVEMEELEGVIVLSDVDELVFTGYTVRQEVDIEGKTRNFLELEVKYFKVTTFHGGNLYLSQDKLVEVLLGEAVLEAESGDIYAHGYPEARLIPADHAEESEYAFVNRYIEEISEILEESLYDML